MKQLCCIGLMTLLISTAGLAAEQTWTGRISSGMCRPEKNAMDHDCILSCIKGGGKYVLITKGQSYGIQNQDFSDLEQHAGHMVKLTGDLGSDGHSIMATKIEMIQAGAK